jgi:hypothetical protein
MPVAMSRPAVWTSIDFPVASAVNRLCLRPVADLAEFAEIAGALDRRWALAAVARLDGLLGSDHELDEHFGAALELHEQGAGSLFERARAELLYGERLRRAKRRVDAREHLRTAIELFDGLGAAPWSEQARRELRASCESIPRRDPTARRS